MSDRKQAVSAEDAIVMLKEGNRRFVLGESTGNMHTHSPQKSDAITEQSPFAIILGCSDSRVPAEMVFDQGLGDLFVIRVAGNIVAPSQVGSIEFAAARFGSRLVVVLGHSRCGAILATLDELQQAAENQSRNLHSIVSRIRPSVEGLMDSAADMQREELVERAVRANVKASVNHLRYGSDILEQLVASQGLSIIGAEYSLETGMVEFFDDQQLQEQ
jgi:carbonic anhydrase